MPHFVYLLLPLVLIACTPPLVHAEDAPGLAMRLSSERVLLGEPVWVVVTAHNPSSATIAWNPGDYCFAFGGRPVTAEVPEAAPGPAQPKKCSYGEAGGNCMMGGNTVHLAPDQTVTFRFVLEGNFHFTHPGAYALHLTLHPGMPFVAGASGTPPPARPEPVRATLTLVLLPATAAALLAREQQLAAMAEKQQLDLTTRPRVIGYNQAVRDADMMANHDAYQTRYGLSLFPAPGMEPTFHDWLQRQPFSDAARTGLANLNTPEARRILREAAAQPAPGQWNLLYAYAQTRDPDGYSLLLKLLGSSDANVHRAAVLNLGLVGGALAVPKLVELAHSPSEIDRNDALSSLGEAHSPAAVDALLQLMEEGNRRYDESWPLFELTHRSPQQSYAAWRQWWAAEGKHAPVYSVFECAAPELLH